MNKKLIKAAGIRAVRTICQTALSCIGTTAALGRVDWVVVASTSVAAGICSILTSVITGLPEV